MGISIDLEKINYHRFIEKLMENKKVNNRYLLEKIMLEFGNKIGNDLVILHNEYYEDGICTWNMCNMIDEVFKLKGSESSYSIYSNLRIELTSYKEIEKAYENLGIERKENTGNDE